MKAAPQARAKRGRCERRFPVRSGIAVPVSLAILRLLCILFVACPATGWAQDAASVSGLKKGERDTMRMDERVKGREEQVIDARVSDQKIGYEERRIRLERRVEELLREEEGARNRQEQWVESEATERERARRRQAEDIERKKRALDVSPDL